MICITDKNIFVRRMDKIIQTASYEKISFLCSIGCNKMSKNFHMTIEGLPALIVRDEFDFSLNLTSNLNFIEKKKTSVSEQHIPASYYL